MLQAQQSSWQSGCDAWGRGSRDKLRGRPGGGLPLAAKAEATAIAPEPQFAYSGEYPLARFLYLSVNYKPGSTLDPLRREFLRYVLSGSGQADVKKDGYLPVTAPIAKRALESVGITAQ